MRGFRGGVPGGLVAVVLGTSLAWWQGFAPTGAFPAAPLGVQIPVPWLGDLIDGLASGHLVSYLGVIVPKPHLRWR